jgi:hydrogenase maturation protein HypF
MERGVAREIISTKFHNTIASAVQTMVEKLRRTHGLNDVALSGGTFQNLYLLNRITSALSTAGLNIFTNHQVPCNDACISLGQAYLIRERIKKAGTQNVPD